jgi:hypothetical protein
MFLKNIFTRIFRNKIPEAPSIKASHPPGHFYSPVSDIKDLHANQDKIWHDSDENIGINFNYKNQLFVLEELFPKYYTDYDYPNDLEIDENLSKYFNNNPAFGWLDSRLLFVLIRHLKPKRIYEIGAGLSTLLTADINSRFFDNKIKFFSAEPYPANYLKKKIPGLNELIVQKAENLPVSVFSRLEENDILFIDSSHVSKTGSDVNYLIFEVLPRLNKGVVIHIHDIFLPREYPKKWVLEDGRSWNEQYLVRALLLFSDTFEIYAGSAFCYYKFPELVRKALNIKSGNTYGGSSLWIRKIK